MTIDHSLGHKTNLLNLKEWKLLKLCSLTETELNKINSRRISDKSVLKASRTLLNNPKIKQNSQRKKGPILN